MPDLTVRALTAETWQLFADLVERHNGVYGGCWCLWFHPRREDRKTNPDGGREYKQRLVCEDRAHAALVIDGDVAVGWCQFGSPEELPNIYHRAQYLAEADLVPDYRITCMFVDKRYRRRHAVGRVGLAGAVELIAGRGGGVVEGYPRDTSDGRKVSVSGMYNGSRSMFEDAGFEFVRTKGQFNCVMRKTVPCTPGREPEAIRDPSEVG